MTPAWDREAWLERIRVLKASLRPSARPLVAEPPSDPPRPAQRHGGRSPAPAGIPPSFYDLRDPPGKGLAPVVQMDDGA